ncbi:Tetratricopeptide repeat-containing protein [Chryseobacterium sp. RU37D]|uniref:hypothetical protein n=1 Tax=Chryseobacterium sp. RU37D TaxID=1907397 RepID=UPI0009548C20|nr:hypothetical protein [Chryseobacterium sp. RU37D]SIQ69486.1 Tetratricopeptide repeat-containing protein [Chryseobacterium sp. RU37D]
MIRALIFLLISLFLLNSCHSENDNEYFRDIDKEVTAVNQDMTKVSAIYKKELKKYHTTGNIKYLLSSKYVESSLYKENEPKKISVIYELLRINDDQNDFITVACNFFLALEIEDSSPKLSLQFLNEAIKLDEKKENHYYLPHLYHAKGRWYFEHQNYSQAQIYFKKSVSVFKKADKLYVASMYNNFGMCKAKMKDYDGSIKMVQYGINLLRSKKKLNEYEDFFLHVMIGNLGWYYFQKKDYDKAEKYFAEQIDFQIKTKKFQYNIVRNSDELFKLYLITNQPDKERYLADLIIKIVPNLTDTKNKILAYRLLQKYFAKTNNIKELKKYSDELVKLNIKYNIEITKELDNVSDVLNGYIIKNINQKYDFAIKDQKRKGVFLMIFVLIIIIIFFNIIIKIREKNTQEKENLEQMNLLLESNREILEKDILLQRGKIKNLHMNLNLKIETEKAFLENLKKIKKSKNIDAEETVKDLFFKINNLLQIDEKNTVNESSAENKEFMEKLSGIFPFLSEQDLKLCAYFRLNLSSKEISLLENITPGSVRVYKTKIKAKLGLGKEEDLVVFLNTIK